MQEGCGLTKNRHVIAPLDTIGSKSDRVEFVRDENWSLKFWELKDTHRLMLTGKQCILANKNLVDIIVYFVTH